MRIETRHQSAPGDRVATMEYDAELLKRWTKLQRWTLQRFGKEADIEGLLFLVGIQELGQGFVPELDKARKEQCVLEGTYAVLATLGYYERAGMEASGHWIWEQAAPLPAALSTEAEEFMLRKAVVRYFDQHHKGWTDEL